MAGDVKPPGPGPVAPGTLVRPVVWDAATQRYLGLGIDLMVVAVRPGLFTVASDVGVSDLCSGLTAITLHWAEGMATILNLRRAVGQGKNWSHGPVLVVDSGVDVDSSEVN